MDNANDPSKAGDKYSKLERKMPKGRFNTKTPDRGLPRP